MMVIDSLEGAVTTQLLPLPSPHGTMTPGGAGAGVPTMAEIGGALNSGDPTKADTEGGTLNSGDPTNADTEGGTLNRGEPTFADT